MRGSAGNALSQPSHDLLTDFSLWRCADRSIMATVKKYERSLHCTRQLRRPLHLCSTLLVLLLPFTADKSHDEYSKQVGAKATSLFAIKALRDRGELCP
jgi:hypothetical protein